MTVVIETRAVKLRNISRAVSRSGTQDINITQRAITILTKDLDTDSPARALASNARYDLRKFKMALL